ncbi:MAG: hypothetical protein FWF44_02700 [Defluviitaleaceae bacterium]|nr:hypothetical protein [Defluviitaleaceae bacterium]
MNSLPWKIFALAISLFFIIGGLTGKMVLRWTNSSAALTVVGFILLAGDIYLLVTQKRRSDKARLEKAEAAGRDEAFAEAIIADTAALETPYQINAALNVENYLKAEIYGIILNGEGAGQLSNAERKIAFETNKVKNALCAVSERNGAKAYMFFEVTGEPEEYSEFVLYAGAFRCSNALTAKIRILRPEDANAAKGADVQVSTDPFHDDGGAAAIDGAARQIENGRAAETPEKLDEMEDK